MAVQGIELRAPSSGEEIDKSGAGGVASPTSTAPSPSHRFDDDIIPQEPPLSAGRIPEKIHRVQYAVRGKVANRSYELARDSSFS